jgi:hypothetical protein
LSTKLQDIKKAILELIVEQVPIEVEIQNELTESAIQMLQGRYSAIERTDLVMRFKIKNSPKTENPIA